MPLRIDSSVLERRLEALAEIGRDADGGWTRLVYSDEERAAARLVAGWMEESGLRVRRDAVGNLFGRWPAVEGPAIWTGSHLDSVRNGGRFDGPAGVLSSLGAVEAVRAASVHPAVPLEVCVFVGEEGSRFSGGLLGSRAVVEGLSHVELESTDDDGTTLAEAMRKCGLEPERADDARVTPDDVVAYLELHIEQGPVLEEAGFAVGIVTGIAGPLFLRGEVKGRADHAGTTPMRARRDSLLAVAEVALALERIAAAGATTVGTVGRVVARPGAHNVIAGLTEFTVDLRDIDLEARDRAERELRSSLAEILEARGLEGALREELRVRPQPVPEVVLDVLRGSAAAVDVPVLQLPSGAAHDAMVVGRIAPSGMIFVRSIDGRSHTPEEESRGADIAAGASILAGALARLGSGELRREPLP